MEKWGLQVFNFNCKICDHTDKIVKTTDLQTIVECLQCGYITVFENEDLDTDLLDLNEDV